MLSHSNLATYYKSIFALAQHHKYSLDELEATIPFERYIYTDLLIMHLERLKEEQQQ